MNEQESVKLKHLCSNAIVAQAGSIDASSEAYQELFAYIDCIQAKLDAPNVDNAIIDDILVLIRNYNNEIGVHGPITKESLIKEIRAFISSHRKLRNWNIRRSEDLKADREKEREKAYEDAKTYALENEWFSKERLKGMTLAELSKLIYEEE